MSYGASKVDGSIQDVEIACWALYPAISFDDNKAHSPLFIDTIWHLVAMCEIREIFSISVYGETITEEKERPSELLV